MKHRPTILVVIAGLLGAMAVSGPLHIMYIDSLGPTEFDEVLSRLSLFQWLLLTLGLMCSVLVYQASPLIRMVLPVLTIVVVAHHYKHWAAHDISLWNAAIASLGFVALNLPLLHPNILSLLNHPERRWWRTAPRRQVELPIFLGGALKGELRSKTFEISETGAYIYVGAGAEVNFQIGEVVSVCVTLGALKQLRCVGRVVRIAEAHGRYPKGLAIEFDAASWEQKRDLKRFVAA